MHYQNFNAVILIDVFFPVVLLTNKYATKRKVFRAFFDQPLIDNNGAVLNRICDVFFIYHSSATLSKENQQDGSTKKGCDQFYFYHTSY